MRQLSPIQLWNQYGAFLTDELDAADAIFAEEFARHMSRSMHRDFPGAQRIMQAALLVTGQSNAATCGRVKCRHFGR